MASTTTHELTKEELADYGKLLGCELPAGSYLKTSTIDGKHDTKKIFSGNFQLIGYETADGWVNVITARGRVNAQPADKKTTAPKTNDGSALG